MRKIAGKTVHYYKVNSYATGCSNDYVPTSTRAATLKDARKAARQMVKDGASHADINVRIEIYFPR